MEGGRRRVTRSRRREGRRNGTLAATGGGGGGREEDAGKERNGRIWDHFGGEEREEMAREDQDDTGGREAGRGWSRSERDGRERSGGHVGDVQYCSNDAKPTPLATIFSLYLLGIHLVLYSGLLHFIPASTTVPGLPLLPGRLPPPPAASESHRDRGPGAPGQTVGLHAANRPAATPRFYSHASSIRSMSLVALPITRDSPVSRFPFNTRHIDSARTYLWTSSKASPGSAYLQRELTISLDRVQAQVDLAGPTLEVQVASRSLDDEGRAARSSRIHRATRRARYAALRSPAVLYDYRGTAGGRIRGGTKIRAAISQEYSVLRADCWPIWHHHRAPYPAAPRLTQWRAFIYT